MILSPLIISKKGFTIVELIIGMAIFAIGMTGILALLGSTIENSFISRHEIVASNLLREEVELIKNIRNTNIRSYVDWDKNSVETTSSSFTGGVFLIENNWISPQVSYSITGDITSSSVYMKDVTSSFSSLLPADLSGRFSATRLYVDDRGRFTHFVTGSGTSFASYLIISPLSFESAGTQIVPKDTLSTRPQGYILDARVIVSSRGSYREYDLKTLITDWKK